MIETLLTTIYSLIFIFIIFKSDFFITSGISKRIFAIIFIIKILSGITLSLIYTYHYKDRSTSDIFKFFDDAKNIIYKQLFIHPLDYLRIVTGIDSGAKHLKPVYDSMMCWYKGFNYDLYNENRTIIRLNAIIMIFSFGYYNVHIVFMSFLSLTGLTAIYKLFYPVFSNKKYELIAAVFLVPSVLIWTSGILKEGLIIFALGLLLFSYNNIFILKKFRLCDFILFFLSFALLIITKLYIVFAIIPGIISIWWTSRSPKRILIKFLIVHFVFLFSVINCSFFVNNFDLISIISKKQHDFVNFVNSLPNVGSKINVNELQDTWISVVKNSPAAFFTSFLRPSVFEINSLLICFVAIENLIILFLFVKSVIFINEVKKINVPYFYFCIFFMIIIYTLSGLTTPVLGALVRYKAPALPFVLIITLYLTDSEKVNRVINKI